MMNRLDVINLWIMVAVLGASSEQNWIAITAGGYAVIHIMIAVVRYAEKL